MLIRAYIDESSTHRDPNSPLILFGYGIRYGRLGAFESAWRKAIAKGPVEYAHAKELLDSDGPFEGWPQQKKFHFAKRLDKLVHKHFEFGFCTVLARDDFLQYRKDKELNTMLDSDYGVSFRTCLSFLNLAVPALIPAKEHEVYVLAEDGHSNSGCVSELQRRMMHEVDNCIVRGVSLVKKKKCYGTQAADIHAFATLQEERTGKITWEDIGTGRVLPEEFSSKVEAFSKVRKFPVFRLPITQEVLADLRDNVILSRGKFQKRFGHLLSSAKSS